MLAETLTWTLLHFLWQGVLIGFLLLLILRFAPAQDDARRAGYRYAAAILALALVILAPLLTFSWQWIGISTHVAGNIVNSSLAVTGTIDAAAAWQLPPVLLRLLLAGWAAGVSWYAMKMVLAWVALLYLQRTQVHATPQWVARQVDALMTQMSILRPVRIVVSGVINTPMTMGWLRPVIIIPASLLTSMQVEQLRLLLAHELAHVRRHDYVVNIIQNLVRILLFYHPLVHWICRILDEERELCCDHIALECSSSRLQYAKALLSLQEQPHPLPALAAASTCKYALLRRIRRILGEPATAQSELRQRPLLGLISLLVSLAVFMSAFSSIDYSRAAIQVTPDHGSHAAMVPARLQSRYLLDELYLRAEEFQQPSSSDIIEPMHLTAGLTLPSAAPVMSAQQKLDPQHSMITAGEADGISTARLDSAADELAVDSGSQSVEDLQRQHQQRQQLALQLERVREQFDLRSLTSDHPDSADFALTSGTELSLHTNVPVPALVRSDYSPRADTLPEPLYQTKPRMPARMLDKHMIVIVNLVYSIDAAGKPTDILVAEDSDDYRDAFAQAAADALRQWQYPLVSDQLQQKRIKQQFIFMQPAESKRCITGSRLCVRDSYTVENLIINS